MSEKMDIESSDEDSNDEDTYYGMSRSDIVELQKTRSTPLARFGDLQCQCRLVDNFGRAYYKCKCVLGALVRCTKPVAHSMSNVTLVYLHLL